MKKNLLKTLSIVALASTLVACGKTKTVKEEWTDEELAAWAEDNGYEIWTEAEKEAFAEQWAEDNDYAPVVAEDTRAELEVAFGSEMSPIDAPYLANYIGKVGGTGETFGEKKDMLVFYGINECGTCDAIKPIVNAWVSETGNKVYYYNPDNSAAQDADKAAMLKKLGSTDGITLTGPLLIAFVDGVKVDSLSGTEITAESINTFAAAYFRDDLGAKTVKASKELETLADLRKSLANDEQFILYATRYNCPWCRKLADTARDNALNKLMREYTGNLYTITSEKVLAEFNNVWVKGEGETLEVVEKCKYDSAFTFIFSPRVGTPAAKMQDNLSQEEKNNRLYKLNDLVNKYAKEANLKYQDQVVKVLLEGTSEKDDNMLMGYTETMKLVNVKADKKYIGQIKNVKITDVKTWSMDGELID